MFKNLKEFNQYIKVYKSKLALSEDKIEMLNYKISDIKLDVLSDYYTLQSDYQDTEKDLNDVKSELIRYYKEEYNYRIETSKELFELVYSDKKYLDIKTQLNTKESMLKGMEDLLSTITSMSFQIKNAIEYLKLKRDMI